eukprot:TRINITY_DN162_c0_g1_i1.p1 TRINITY_DN162_c0_g1~~TRINITY_DN162_c0_g1_i1.p1  ORF type:complete len:263 (-),score=63.07 TRINITY_DN162_c0_g1_i1:60-818(-)
MAEVGFFSLSGKVAIVTGGGQSIGRGICERFAKAGVIVGVFDIDKALAEETAKAIGGVALIGNVTSEEDCKNAVAKMKTHSGKAVDILVNCAGIVGRTANMWDLKKEDLEKVMSVNVTGPFLFSNAVLPDMFQQKYGRIINIASISGKEGNPRMVPYSTSKGAIITLTKALAKEVVGNGNDITVNCISPAVVQTKILEQVDQKTIDYMISKIPLGRTCKIEEVAALVHYLASPEASFTTGQCYDISGGRATY